MTDEIIIRDVGQPLQAVLTMVMDTLTLNLGAGTELADVSRVIINIPKNHPRVALSVIRESE